MFYICRLKIRAFFIHCISKHKFGISVSVKECQLLNMSLSAHTGQLMPPKCKKKLGLFLLSAIVYGLFTRRFHLIQQISVFENHIVISYHRQIYRNNWSTAVYRPLLPKSSTRGSEHITQYSNLYYHNISFVFNDLQRR
jgi:hypothetical protein